MRTALKILLLAILFLFSAPSVSRADFEKGRKAAQQGQYQEALKIWQPLAKAGDARAQFYIGRLYANGNGVSQDFKLAFRWFRLAAAQGFGPSYLALAKMYSRGDGTEINLAEARRFAELALQKGEAASGLIKEIESLSQAAQLQKPTRDISGIDASAIEPARSSVSQPAPTSPEETGDPILGLALLGIILIVFGLLVRGLYVRLKRFKQALQEQLRQAVKQAETKINRDKIVDRFHSGTRSTKSSAGPPNTNFDPHAVLGVPVGVTQHDLLKAFREKLHQNQPDKAVKPNSESQRAADQRAIILHKAYDALKMGGIRR